MMEIGLRGHVDKGNKTRLKNTLLNKFNCENVRSREFIQGLRNIALIALNIRFGLYDMLGPSMIITTYTIVFFGVTGDKLEFRGPIVSCVNHILSQNCLVSRTLACSYEIEFNFVCR